MNKCTITTNHASDETTFVPLLPKSAQLTDHCR